MHINHNVYSSIYHILIYVICYNMYIPCAITCMIICVLLYVLYMHYNICVYIERARKESTMFSDILSFLVVLTIIIFLNYLFYFINFHFLYLFNHSTQYNMTTASPLPIHLSSFRLPSPPDLFLL